MKSPRGREETMSRVGSWADQELSFEDAVGYLLSRCEQACDRKHAWSLFDIAAVRVVCRKAEEHGMVRDNA